MNLVSTPANPVPDDVVSGTIKTRDGADLRFARWAPPAGRKGTVGVFTGLTLLSSNYELVGQSGEVSLPGIDIARWAGLWAWMENHLSTTSGSSRHLS